MGLSLKYQPSLSVTNPKKSKAGINLPSGSLGLIWKAGGSRESGDTARGTARAGGMPDSGRGFEQWCWEEQGLCMHPSIIPLQFLDLPRLPPSQLHTVQISFAP